MIAATSSGFNLGAKNNGVQNETSHDLSLLLCASFSSSEIACRANLSTALLTLINQVHELESYEIKYDTESVSNMSKVKRCSDVQALHV